MKHNSLEHLLSKGCVYTGSCNCDYCPYVIYPTDSEELIRMCEKETYEECCNSVERG